MHTSFFTTAYMRLFTTITRRLSPTALLPLLLLFVSSCSSYNYRENGTTSLTFAGIIYLVLGVYALLSLLKQDWSLTKKLVWGAIIWFVPIPGLGAIIYLLFSGRSK